MKSVVVPAEQRLITNTKLRELHQLAYEQASAGGLPSGNGGSHFGYFMVICDELIALKDAFRIYANHTRDCLVARGLECDCGCAKKRKLVEESIR